MAKIIQINPPRTLLAILAITMMLTATGCDPCLTNPCNNGLFCDGVEICTANGSSFTCTDGTSPCSSGLICIEDTDTCTICLTDQECDDSDACTGIETCDSSTQRCIAGTLIDCDDIDLCTTDICDSVSGACSNTPVECEAPENCDPNTGLCAQICLDDTDCDDGLFCTGTETCNTVNNSCEAGTSPCAVDATCDEFIDICSACACEPFTFTIDSAGDAFTGTPGNDTFIAPIGTLQTVDILVGNGGNDTLNATIADSIASLATIIDIDTINFTVIYNAIFDTHAIFDAANCQSIGVWNIIPGSTGGIALSNLEAFPVITLGSNYSQTLSAKLADVSGTSDQIKVTLNGTAKGATINTPDDAALELLIIEIKADSWLTAASPGVSFFGSNASPVNTILLGSGMLTLDGGVGSDLVADTYNFTGYTGNTAVSMANNPGPTNVSNLPRVVRYTINDITGGQNHAVTFAATHNNVTVDVNTIPAAESLGTLTLNQGTNNNDSITVNLGGAGTGSGAITAAATEFLTINSGGTTANVIANVTTNTSTPFVTESVTVLGTQNVTLGTVTTERVDASALTGTMSMTASGNQPMQIIGGSGNDTLTGSANVELIDGNDGNDVIDGQGGADTIDGGGGNDTIAGGTGVDNVTGGTGLDTLRVSAAAANGADRDLFLDFDDNATTGDVVNLNSGVATLTGTDNFASTATIQTHSSSGAVAVLAATEVLVVTSATVADLTSANSLNGTNLITAIGGAITGAMGGQNDILIAVADAAGNVGVYHASSADNAIIAAEITLVAVLSGADVTLANMVYSNFSNTP